MTRDEAIKALFSIVYDGDAPFDAPDVQWAVTLSEELLGAVEPVFAELDALKKRMEWKPIADAPKDRLIEVYCPPFIERGEKVLSQLVCLSQWYPDGEFCVCELRKPTHYREIDLPEDVE